MEEWNGKKDLLNRKKESEFLTTYLLKRHENNPSKPFVLNINAEWGFGKTFFLQNLSEDLKNQDYPILYFDAWQNDYTNEPLISFISEMDTLLTPFFSKDKKIRKSFKDLIKSSKNLFLPVLLKKITGHGLDELEDLIEDKPEILDTPQSEDEVTTEDDNKDLKNEVSSIISKAATSVLAEHQTIKNSIIEFKKNMGILLKLIESTDDINLPMFIFIDELDRCRPNYAIELLESVKHIFDIPGITFVIATDSKQLSHSVNAIYGNNFASERYLKRFFDQEYTLTDPDSYLFAEYLFEIHNIKGNRELFSPLHVSSYAEEDINMNVKLFSLYSDYFKLSYRDQEQVATSLSAITLVWDNDKPIHLGYILFLLILKQKNNELFKRFNESNLRNQKSFLKDDLNKIEVNENIKFKSYNSGEIKEYILRDMIQSYLDKIDINSSNAYTSNEGKAEFEKKIKTKIQEKLPLNYNSYDHPKYNFDIYPDLVLRTGQFS